jgi:hypothetical protein
MGEEREKPNAFTNHQNLSQKLARKAKQFRNRQD